MTYTRIASALFAVMVPFSALAADMSASDVIGAVLTDTRPETLFLRVMKKSQGRTMVLNVTGAREGGMEGKMWTKTSMVWRTGQEWIKVDAEMRLKNNKAYLMLKNASASAGLPVVAEFSAAAGQWYELDLSDPAVKTWFMSGANSSALASLFSLDRTKYQGGYSNKFTFTGDTSVLASLLREALPLLVSPDTLNGVHMKVDTNGQGAFQYAILKGDTFEARVQRQLGAVYVETPKGNIKPLPRGEIANLFFSGTSGETAEKPKAAVASSVSSSVSTVNHDVSSEMRLPSTKNSVKVGVTKRTAERAIIDLLGPNGVNVKRTVRLAVTKVQWDSLSAFRFDFSRDGGILHTYPTPTKAVFTTKDAYAPLDVIFFDEKGSFISSARMLKCESSVCPEYTADRAAKFALLVEEGFIIKHKVGNLWRLDLSWYKLPQSTELSPQEVDRMAKRNLVQRQAIKANDAARAQGEGGYESLRTLASLLAGKVRSADIAALGGVRADDKVAMSLYTLLFDTVKSNEGITYAYIVRPTDIQSAFALLVDNFTFASKETLDTDNSGIVESDEEPARVGTLYTYSALKEALVKTTFVHLADNGDVTVFAPVRDDNGNVVALVALMQPANGGK